MAKSRTIRRPLVATAALVSAVSACSDQRAAEPESTGTVASAASAIVGTLIRGSGASAQIASSDGCLSTGLDVFLNDNVVNQPGGPGTPTTLLEVDFSVYDVCAQQLVAVGFGGGVQPFTVTYPTSAQISATFLVFDPSIRQTRTLALDLTWTSSASNGPIQAEHIDANTVTQVRGFPSTREEHDHEDFTYRAAWVSGTAVLDGTYNLVVNVEQLIARIEKHTQSSRSVQVY
jgi:hypothetical protein